MKVSSLHYLRGHVGILTGATLLAFVGAGLGALLAMLIGPASEVLIQQPSQVTATELFGERMGPSVGWALGRNAFTYAEVLGLVPWALLFVAALKTLSMFIHGLIWEKTTESIARDLRSEVVKRYLLHMPDSAGSLPQIQEISALTTTDIRILREYLLHFFGGVPREILLSIIYLGLAATLSWELFLIFALGLAPSFYLITRIGKKIRRRSGSVLDQYAAVTEWIQLRLLGIETIKHYGTEELEVAKFALLNNELKNKLLRVERVKARTSPVADGFATLAVAVVLLIAVYTLQSGNTSGSVMVSFFASLGFLSQALSKLARYYNTNREGQAAAARVSGFLEIVGRTRSQNPRVRHQSTSLQEFDEPGAPAVLSLRRATVHYPNMNTPALDQFSYVFRRGRVCSVWGPSGAGKSSLVRAILGMAALKSGEICADSRSGEELKIGYMPQLFQLIPGTIADNVQYPDSRPADPNRIRGALAATAMEHMLDSLPLGINHPIPVGDDNFSGGQRQRILLARLFYHTFDVAIIDEGTSALDRESEAVVLASIQKLASMGVAVVIVAHRQKIAEVSDEFVVLNKGRTQATGTSSDGNTIQTLQKMFEISEHPFL